LRWELEPPDHTVIWLEPHRVFVGSLPRLRLEPASAFRGAALQVVCGDPTAGGRSFYLTLGREIPVSVSGGVGTADLNGVQELRHRYGRISLRCQPPGRPDHPPLALTFSRLPQMGLRYIPDRAKPGSAMAV
jgi:hypothetical protein